MDDDKFEVRKILPQEAVYRDVKEPQVVVDAHYDRSAGAGACLSGVQLGSPQKGAITTPHQDQRPMFSASHLVA
jgi:hypothetical protein